MRPRYSILDGSLPRSLFPLHPLHIRFSGDVAKGGPVGTAEHFAEDGFSGWNGAGGGILDISSIQKWAEVVPTEGKH